jgi:hypothetical protein
MINTTPQFPKTLWASTCPRPVAAVRIGFSTFKPRNLPKWYEHWKNKQMLTLMCPRERQSSKKGGVSILFCGGKIQRLEKGRNPHAHPRGSSTQTPGLALTGGPGGRKIRTSKHEQDRKRALIWKVRKETPRELLRLDDSSRIWKRL